MADPGEWLRSLPPSLDRQRAVIGSYLATARADARIRIVVVGCSIGRGVGDELSDIDGLIGVRPDAWDGALRDSRSWIERACRVVDMNQLILPEGASADTQYQHTFALYENGVEVDLVVSRVRPDWKRRADWVVLYDPDRSAPLEVTRSTQTVDDLRRWFYAVLTRLSAVGKYATRGALWEALNVLELARADTWRIWSVAQGVPDAQYGVTAVFDDPRRPVPAAMARTVASLDPSSLVTAALVCCEIASDAWPRAMAAIGERDGALPPLAPYVHDRLRKVATG